MVCVRNNGGQVFKMSTVVSDAHRESFGEPDNESDNGILKHVVSDRLQELILALKYSSDVAGTWGKDSSFVPSTTSPIKVW